MYTFSNKLKTFSIILMVLGLLGVGYGFMTSHKSFEEVEHLLASEEAHHGGGHGEEATHAAPSHDTHASNDAHGEEAHAAGGEDTHKKHVEHVMHQIHNRPWSALYVAAFFFMMIALGVLAFYAIQIASQAGWSPVLL